MMALLHFIIDSLYKDCDSIHFSLPVQACSSEMSIPEISERENPLIIMRKHAIGYHSKYSALERKFLRKHVTQVRSCRYTRREKYKRVSCKCGFLEFRREKPLLIYAETIFFVGTKPDSLFSETMWRMHYVIVVIILNIGITCKRDLDT